MSSAFRKAQPPKPRNDADEHRSRALSSLPLGHAFANAWFRQAQRDRGRKSGPLGPEIPLIKYNHKEFTKSTSSARLKAAVVCRRERDKQRHAVRARAVDKTHQRFKIRTNPSVSTITAMKREAWSVVPCGPPTGHRVNHGRGISPPCSRTHRTQQMKTARWQKQGPRSGACLPSRLLPRSATAATAG